MKIIEKILNPIFKFILWTDVIRQKTVKAFTVEAPQQKLVMVRVSDRVSEIAPEGEQLLDATIENFFTPDRHDDGVTMRVQQVQPVSDEVNPTELVVDTVTVVKPNPGALRNIMQQHLAVRFQIESCKRRRIKSQGARSRSLNPKTCRK